MGGPPMEMDGVNTLLVLLAGALLWALILLPLDTLLHAWRSVRKKLTRSTSR